MKLPGSGFNGSRIVRVAAVALLAAFIFSALIDGASAAKFTVQNGVATSLLTPVSGVKQKPVIEMAPTSTPEATVVSPIPTDVAAVNANLGTEAGQANPYNFVEFDMYVCPKGYAGTNDGLQALADCHNRASGIAMHLINADGDQAKTSTDMVSWGYLRPGPITVKESLSGLQNQPMVFCRGVNGIFVQQAVSGGAINASVAANTEIYCDWFVMPKRSPLDGVEVTTTGVLSQGGNTQVSPGSLYLNGIGCPAGFDAASVDIYGLALNCHDAGPNALWYVTDGALLSQSVSGSDASFSNLAPGTNLAGYLIPPPYGNPRVFCKSQQGDAELEVAVSDGFFHVNVVSGQAAYCDVFSIPAAATTGATVISDTNTCTEANVNGDFSHPNLAQTCSNYLNDVSVTATANGQQVGYATTLTGVAEIHGLPVGDVQLKADSASVTPADLIVYCNISGVGDDQQIQANGDQIDVNLTNGETMNCSWFFISNANPITGGPTVPAAASPIATSDGGAATPIAVGAP